MSSGKKRVKPVVFQRTFKRIPDQNEKRAISESQKALVVIFCRGTIFAAIIRIHFQNWVLEVAGAEPVPSQ